jgi:hypothetical protein
LDLAHRDAAPWRDTELMFHSFGMPVPIADVESDSSELVRVLLYSKNEFVHLTNMVARICSCFANTFAPAAGRR